jgi:hypothetical protein
MVEDIRMANSISSVGFVVRGYPRSVVHDAAALAKSLLRPNKKISLLGIDVAGNWASVHDLLLDVGISNHSTILTDGYLGVVLHSVAWAPSWITIHAYIDCIARLSIFGLVLLASHVRNCVLVNPTECGMNVTTTTTSSCATV